MRAVPAQQVEPNAVERGHVYFVATPLGNLQDMSPRAKSILSTVDIIAAEDTRTTGKLLKLLGLEKHGKLVSHHEYNWQTSTPELVKLALQGSSVALVSDAGTPGISDPGAPLAAACAAAGVPVHPIPGPSAVSAALSICGFSGSPRFTFFGFLPVKGRERKEAAADVMRCQHPAVIFEAPHRVQQTMNLLLELVGEHGDKRVVCCRELTKMHEEVFRAASISQTVAWLAASAGEDGGAAAGERIRGEFTIVLAPQEAATGHAAEAQVKTKQAQIVLARLLELQADGVSRSDAVRLVCGMADVSASRSAVYRCALDMDGWMDAS